jgi:hypothetical protein
MLIEAHSLALTILAIKPRNTRYSIDIISCGELDTKDAPTIPESIVLKELLVVSIVGFAELTPKDEADLLEH